MSDLERLLAIAEEASKLWRHGDYKAKRPAREIINELDYVIADIKKRMGRESTRVIHRQDARVDLAGE